MLELPAWKLITRIQGALAFKEGFMRLQFKTVSVTISGDYYQVLFHDDLDIEDEPHFLIQRQFEFPDGGV